MNSNASWVLFPTRRLLTRAARHNPLRGDHGAACYRDSSELQPCSTLASSLCSTSFSLSRSWTSNAASIGIIDANLFAEEILEAGEREDRHRSAAPVRDDFFEALGFHLEQNSRRISRYAFFSFLRFPWAACDGRRAEPSARSWPVFF